MTTPTPDVVAYLVSADCQVCGKELDPPKDEWLIYYPRKQPSVTMCGGLACITRYMKDEA